MEELDRRLAAGRARAEASSPLAQYLTGVAAGIIPALLFAIATVAYNVTHFSGAWGAVALLVVWLYLPVGCCGLLCLVVAGFRALRVGILSAIAIGIVVSLQTLQPAW